MWSHGIKLAARNYVGVAKHLASQSELTPAIMKDISIYLGQIAPSSSDHPDCVKIVRRVSDDLPGADCSVWEERRSELLNLLLTAAADLVEVLQKAVPFAGSQQFADWFLDELHTMTRR